jgi:hypothetical protein
VSLKLRHSHQERSYYERTGRNSIVYFTKIEIIPHRSLYHLSFINLAGELSKSKSIISKHADNVRDVMLAVKGSTVESELLRLTTDLRPKAVKTCKWTEKASTTSCFLNLFDHLVLLADNKDSRVNFDTKNSFKLQTQKFSRQWDAFAQLHGRLQEDGLPRNKGQILINTLHKTIEENREKRGHPFQGCELKNTHSMLGNHH